MSIKLALLKSGETIISDAKELIAEDKVCGYLFDKPHKVEYAKPIFLSEDINAPPSGELQVTLSPWIVITTESQIPVSTDWVVTIVEPMETIKEMYIERVGKNTEEDDD